MAARGTPSPIDRARTEQLIHSRINGIRHAHDLNTLEYDTELREIARNHSQDMAERSFFDHVNPDGETVADRYERHGYDCQIKTQSGPIRSTYTTGGENIARTSVGVHVQTEDGPKLSEDEDDVGTTVVRGWMESDGHRENLLEGHWNREAIGIYIAQATGFTNVFVTQNFC